MAWVRGGDTSATYPPVMRVAGLSGADERSVNEVMGFVTRLAYMSAAHTTDYVVDFGTVQLLGGARTNVLLKQAKRVGLLSEVKVDGLRHIKIIEDPDFLHLRLKAEIEWEAQQAADCKNEAITIPVRLRDGDLCRYCGRMVMWTGRPSNRSATFDHLEPGEAGTVDTIVVACRGCNSAWRDIRGMERVTLSASPAERGVKPCYSEWTAGWLAQRGHQVEQSERPGSQPGNAARAKRGSKRPGSQPDHAPVDNSDPGNGTPRVGTPVQRQRPGSQPDTAPGVSDLDDDVGPPRAERKLDSKVEFPVTSEGVSQVFGSGFDRDGSGRDGAGREPSSPNPPSERHNAGTSARKRSSRGRRRKEATR